MKKVTKKKDALYNEDGSITLDKNLNKDIYSKKDIRKVKDKVKGK